MTAPKFQDGDTVHVRATVLSSSPDSDGDVIVRIPHRRLGCDRYAAQCVNPAHIVKVEPRALQVGDIVTWGTGAVCYELRAIDELGDGALVKSDSGYYTTECIHNLRRV